MIIVVADGSLEYEDMFKWVLDHQIYLAKSDLKNAEI